MQILACPHCKQPLKVHDECLGTLIDCPACEGAIKLPEPTTPPAPSTPTEQTSQPKKKIIVGGKSGESKTRTCPYCSEEIMFQAKKCKHCGEFIKGREPEKNEVKQGALIGAIVCLVAGIGLMFFSLLSFLLYAPLFLASFILSIVAMAQKRIVGGIILLLLSLIIPPGLFLGLGAIRGEKVLNKLTEAIQEETVNTHDQTIQNNLKLIQHAKAVWANENSKAESDEVTKADILPYLEGGIPTTPAGAKYQIGSEIGKPPKCWYNGKKYEYQE